MHIINWNLVLILLKKIFFFVMDISKCCWALSPQKCRGGMELEKSNFKDQCN